MLCKDLKVVNLNITEDHYVYKAMMRLCADDLCFDIDLNELTDDIITQIKFKFKIEEPIDEMRNIIMDKVMKASKSESHISEGQNCCKDENNKKIQRSIDSLSMS